MDRVASRGDSNEFLIVIIVFGSDRSPRRGDLGRACVRACVRPCMLGDCGHPKYTNLYVFHSPKVRIWSYSNIKFLIFFLHSFPRIFELTF